MARKNEVILMSGHNFWCIYDFQMSRDHLLVTGDIGITKEEDLIHVFVKGTVNCQFKAE